MYVSFHHSASELFFCHFLPAGRRSFKSTCEGTCKVCRSGADRSFRLVVKISGTLCLACLEIFIVTGDYVAKFGAGDVWHKISRY